MRPIHLRIVLAALLFFVAAVARPQSQTIEVTLLKDDEYVTRAMKVFSKSGERVTGLATIRSFDPATNAFIMEGAAGDTKTIVVSDIDRIEFEQDIRRQERVAQRSPSPVIAMPGRVAMYEVPQPSLRIQNGNLQLTPSWEVRPAPGASAPPQLPQLPGVAMMTAPRVQIAEARLLKYDGARHVFSLQVSYFTYSTEIFGGAGSSSGGKPLQ